MGDANGIVVHQAESGVSMAVQVSGLEAVLRLADVLGKAPQGAVPSTLAGKPAAIAAVLMTAAEMRIGPMEALRGIHMIEGKATLSSGLMLAQAMRAGVRVQWIEKTATAVRAKFTRAGYPDHVEGYTIEEARTAGLTGKAVWKNHAMSMLTARCISRAMVSWAPDVLGAGVYVEGELDEPTREQRPDAIDAEIVDPVAAEFERIGAGLDAAETEADAIAAWEPYAVAKKRLTQEQRAVLMAKKEAAKARLTPVDPEEADRRALLKQEKADAGGAQ